MFEGYPPGVRRKLLAVRRLIFETAARTEGVGRLSETLKWNEPSYSARGGTPIRLGYKASAPQQYAMYFHCQTDLISRFRGLLSEQLTFEGSRAILMQTSAPVPKSALVLCIRAALTYHR